MRKDYQNQEIDTSQPAVPNTVSVALAELAGVMREGLAGPGGRDRPAGDARDHGSGRDRGVRAQAPP